VDAVSAKLETIRVETAERVRAVMEDSKKEVAPLLTPEQQKKLDQLESEHRKIMLHHGFLPPPKDKPPPSP
jgi:Spy/CpxP family protein refolding chaperone